MNTLFSLVVYTANILGIFNDPFEFEGDYGSEVNPIRQTVFEAVVSKEALARNYSDYEIREIIGDELPIDQIELYRNELVSQAIEDDRQHGPILSEVVSPQLLEAFINKQKEMRDVRFLDTDIEKISAFVNRYADNQIFYLMRNLPSQLLHLDKALRDQASLEGHSLDMPILSSTKELVGENAEDLKIQLLNALFVNKTFGLVKSEEVLKQTIKNLPVDYLKNLLGPDAKNQDLEVFCSPSGQLFFYWLYQALNFDLIAKDQNQISQINKVKQIFANSLGDPKVRAEEFKKKLLAANAGVLFTQESDRILPNALLDEGLFLPIEKQNPLDGTFVFLRSDLWQPDYQIMPIEDYDGFESGRINVVLATLVETGEKFLLASGHGHSTRSADGRLQIGLVMKKFRELSVLPENAGLQLLIGIDANTKNNEDVELFREHLNKLGLVGTSVGPTTVKKRMVTAQHSKAGKFAVDEEDYLITLKNDQGGRFSFSNITVGFKSEKPDTTVTLPNQENQSDHYPVGATLH